MRKLTVAAFATACIGAAWGWTSGTVDGLLDSSQGAIPECEESLKSTLASWYTEFSGFDLSLNGFDVTQDFGK